MKSPRLSASSYSNTAPLVWSFMYGSRRGDVELILDNAPARSAELLAQDRVDAALVPVIASQIIDGVRVIPNVCVGTDRAVRSVCLVTDGRDLSVVRSVALDVSSRTSVALTKIIFREFLGHEPEWRDAAPDLGAMLATSDAALLIGDPALSIADLSEPGAIATGPEGESETRRHGDAAIEIRDPHSAIRDLRSFDLAELWHHHTGLGFVFAMWMTRRESCPIDLAAARDEGVENIDSIAANYASSIGMTTANVAEYLRTNIRYATNEKMLAGMDLYFDLAAKHGLIAEKRRIESTNK